MSSRDNLIGVLAFLIAIIVLGAGLGRTPLLQPDEGRNAEVAREMKESGAWLIPTYNGADYLDKPAFYFKAVGLSLAVFGNNEAAARVPSMLFGIALLVATYLFSRRFINRRCAAFAVLIIAATPLYFAYSRLVIFDIAVTFFVVVAIFAGYLAEECEGTLRRRWYLAGAVAAGFATLVKGPVGFIVPALVLLVFNRLEGRSGAWKRLLAPLNLGVFFAVVLPWFIGVSIVHSDFPQYGLVEESFHRFTTGSFRRTKPAYFYPLIIAATFVPWSLLFPESIVMVWRRRSQLTRVDRFCIVWTVAVLLFFSLSKSKMPGYILSLAVSLGILTARLFDRAISSGGRAAQMILRATVTFAVGCVCAAAVVMWARSQAQTIGGVLRFDWDETEKLMGYAPGVIGGLLVVAVLAAVARFRRSMPLSMTAFVIPLAMLILLNGGLLEFLGNRRSQRDLAARLSLRTADADVACLECLPHGLPFYLGKTVTVMTSSGAELSSNYVLFNLNSGSPWPTTLIPVSRRDEWLDSRKRAVWLIAKPEARAVLAVLASSRGGKVVQLTDSYCGMFLPAPGGV